MRGAGHQPSDRTPAGDRWPSVLLAFARIGATAFGGGSATIAAMRQTCRRHGWLDEDAFLDTVVLSRLTPGITILAQALLIGRAVAGLRGMAAAIVGMMAPSITITVTLAWGYAHIRGLPGAATPLAGIAAVAAGFAVSLALQLLRDVLRRERIRRGAVLYLGFLGLSLLIEDTLVVMGIAAAAALVAPALFSGPDISGPDISGPDADPADDD
jgi:chromate transporter